MKPKIRRNDLANIIYQYHKEHINDNVNDYIRNITNIIISWFNNYSFESDSNFYLLGRKKFLYNEFNDYLNNCEKGKDINPYQFACGNLEEFICNDNFIYRLDVDESGINNLIEKNDNYIKS